MSLPFILPLIFTLLMSGVFSGCGKREPDVIKVGVISVLTGQGANYGKAAKTGLDLALDEINSTGGVKGKKISLIYEDSKGDTKDAVSAFQKLVNTDKVPVVIGPFYSGEVLAVAPEAEKAKVIVISGSATSDNIRNAGEYIFRVCPSNDAQGKTLADFAIKHLKAKTAYILFRNVDYGVTLRDAFAKAFTGNGGKVLGQEGVAPDATDTRTQLNKVKNSPPDVIFAPVHYPEGAVLLRQAKELGIKASVMGGDGGFDPELIRIAGNAAEGSYWATVGWGGAETKSITEEFIKKYKQKYNEEPGVYSGLYYDALKVVARALENSSSITGSEIKDALLKIRDYKGPTGVTAFDSLGEVDKPFSVYVAKDAKFVLVQ